jgi:hypothetical protein
VQPLREARLLKSVLFELDVPNHPNAAFQCAFPFLTEISILREKYRGAHALESQQER